MTRFRSANTSPCVDFYEHVCGSAGDAGPDVAGLRQVAVAVTATIVTHHLAQTPPRLHQTASQKASAFLQMCRTRALRHEDNLSALRSYVRLNMLFEDVEFRPLIKIAEQLFVAGLPVFYQMGVDGTMVWRRRYLLTLDVSAAIKIWSKTQKTFAHRTGYTKHVQEVLQDAGVLSDKAEALAAAVTDLDDVVYAAYKQYLANNKNSAKILIVRLEEFAHLVSDDSENKEEWKLFVKKNITEGFPFVPHVFVAEAAVTFLKHIIDKLDDAELRTLISWQMIREVVAASGIVPLVGQYTQWYCIEMTLRIYGHALTVPYFRSFVKRKTLRKTGSVYHNIKGHLMRTANTSQWLRGSSLAVTLGEVQRLKTRAIFPPTLESSDALNEQYRSYPDVRGPFLSACLIGLRVNAKSAISQATALFSDVSANDARKFVAMTVYNRKTNSLFISGSAASAPALDTEGTEEVNYGFFGRIVTQGILHVLAKFTDEVKNSSKTQEVSKIAVSDLSDALIRCLAGGVRERSDVSVLLCGHRCFVLNACVQLLQVGALNWVF
ncbi:hypothetical protein V5799_024609 [Amblyomma americanum]|uniref:Peptidase M13 N-terminal domain-containing protein n=1 Tax=Amblyomma americanum TaxID=6943 RepID=A0AAQ4EBY0_AMBAM